MKFIKRHILIENVLYFSFIFIVTISVSKVLGGYFEDKITKSSCDALNGVYMVGDSIGHSYCDVK